MPNDRPNWGGPRTGAGRPTIVKGEKRVHFGAMVSPKTANLIAAESRRLGVSKGRIIDRLTEEQTKSSPPPANGAPSRP